MHRPLSTVVVWALCLVPAAFLQAAAPAWQPVEPVFTAKCFGCHAGDHAKGGIDLRALMAAAPASRDFDAWERVRDVIEGGDMPPPKAEPLTPEERATLAAAVGRELDTLAAANAGDPGAVTMRRLTNAGQFEYLRRLDGPCRHDHFTPGARTVPLAVLLIFDTCDLTAVKDQLRNMSARSDKQIGSTCSSA